jgi:uncharacterized protein YcfJ
MLDRTRISMRQFCLCVGVLLLSKRPVFDVSAFMASSPALFRSITSDRSHALDNIQKSTDEAQISCFAPPHPSLVTETRLYSSWNNNNNNRRRKDDNDGDQQFKGMGSTAAGAMLGGLVGGPFGALWGASIGASVGAKRAQEAAQNDEMKRMGITPDMVEMAEDCAVSLNNAMEGLRASQNSLESQQSLARRLDRESDRLKEEATVALVEQEDEERARKLLSERLKLLDRLKPALVRCAEEKKRLVVSQDNVNSLEQRAMEIDTLMRRSVSAQTYQDTTLSNFDNRLTLDNEDPLLRKFRELERDS